MEWKVSSQPVDYETARAAMAARVAAIQQGKADELIWLLEHPPLYTAGTSAKSSDLLQAQFPVYSTGRGGQYTYHGPGQRVAYVMLDLNKRGKDVRVYVANLERWIILTLARFDIEGFVREGRVGVWCHPGAATWPSPGSPAASSEKNFRGSRHGGRDDSTNPQSLIPNPELKIAAIGVRVQKWVTSHGIALNVSPDLSHYAGIVPCGIKEHGVTSLAALGVAVTLQEVDAVLKAQFDMAFRR